MIKLLLASNPLEPMAEEQRLTAELELVPAKPLRDYLIDAKLDAPELVVSVNGRIYDAEEQLQVRPVDGDYILLVPRVGNPGLVKTLGAVAVLALGTIATVATAGALAPLVAAGFISATTSAVAVSVLGAAISIGGNLLVSAIAGALSPAQKTASPSYDPDGPRSLAQSGVVIPKGYGLFQWGGNLISSFTDVEGQDSYINALYCYGYGPVRALDTSKILINGKPASEYQNVQVLVRLGTNDQTPLANFNRIVNGYPQQTQCLAGIPVIVPGVGTETLIGQVDIQFPDGVGQHTNDGNLIPLIMIYKVEYSAAGAGNWQPVISPRTTSDVVGYDPVTGNAIPTYVWVLVATDLPPSSGVVYQADSNSHNVGDVESVQVLVAVFQPNGSYYNYNKTCTGEWQLLDPTLNQVYVNTWNEGYINFLGASDQTLYNRTTIYYPSKGKWDVRITKYGSGLFHYTVLPGDNFVPNVHQDMWVHSVNEITPIDLSYPNMILIGVRALATSQLNGSSLTVTALIQHGCRTRDTGLMPAELQAFEDDNPAVVAADMMLDRLYGGGRSPGIQPANIERYIDEWVAWAQLNDQLVDDGNGGSIRRHVFRGVFDTESNLWEALGTVGAMSRAQVLQFGRDYGVYVDQPDVPVQMFSMGNISSDSFTESFLELDSRANQVEVQIRGLHPLLQVGQSRSLHGPGLSAGRRAGKERAHQGQRRGRAGAGLAPGALPRALQRVHPALRLHHVRHPGHRLPAGQRDHPAARRAAVGLGRAHRARLHAHAARGRPARPGVHPRHHQLVGHPDLPRHPPVLRHRFSGGRAGGRHRHQHRHAAHAVQLRQRRAGHARGRHQPRRGTGRLRDQAHGGRQRHRAAATRLRPARRRHLPALRHRRPRLPHRRLHRPRQRAAGPHARRAPAAAAGRLDHLLLRPDRLAESSRAWPACAA